jgi:CheY-like chemotaxis protein
MENRSRFVVNDANLLGHLGPCAREVDLVLRELDHCSDRLADMHPGLSEAIHCCADFLQGFLQKACGIDVRTDREPEEDDDRFGFAVQRLLTLAKEESFRGAERYRLHQHLKNLADRFDAYTNAVDSESLSEDAKTQEVQIKSDLLGLLKQFGVEEDETPVSRQRIVLVEDNPDERDLLTAFLLKRGCDVYPFEDGEDALVFIHGEHPDAVLLLDMNLPHCHGAKVVQSIRNNPLSRAMQIIGMSGASLRDNRMSLGPEGLDFWLRKPFNPNAILDVIDSRSHV